MNKELMTEMLPLSEKIGPLETTVRELKEKYMTLWWNVSSDFPRFERQYDKKEKLHIEKETDLFIDRITAYIDQGQSDQKPGDRVFAESISTGRDFLKKLGVILDIHMEDSFAENFIRSTSIFLNMIKAFDPDLKTENIYQALRNIWIMNSIQVFLGQQIDCTVPMFAYSMLYPYTDNILDDVDEKLDKKLRLCQCLKFWLEGNAHEPANAGEQRIYDMVKKIEAEFNRQRFPGVYQSLLMIFNAQLRSLIQQKQLTPPYIHDVVGISFEKGGCSVLADGFLLKGNLEKKEQDFCFGWGTFLQLSDDIQDIHMDKKNNHTTMFSQIAGSYRMDNMASKLFNYIALVLDEHLALPALKQLKDFSKKNFEFLVLEAVGKNSRLYSRDFVQAAEKFFPFSFFYLKKLRKRLEKRLRKSRNRVLDLDTVSAGLMALSSRLYEK